MESENTYRSREKSHLLECRSLPTQRLTLLSSLRRLPWKSYRKPGGGKKYCYMRKKISCLEYLGEWLSLSRFINDLRAHGARYNNRAFSIMTHPQPSIRESKDFF